MSQLILKPLHLKYCFSRTDGKFFLENVQVKFTVKISKQTKATLELMPLRSYKLLKMSASGIYLQSDAAQQVLKSSSVPTGLNTFNK